MVVTGTYDAISYKPFYKASITKDNETEAFAWLEKNNHSDNKTNRNYSSYSGQSKMRRKRSTPRVLA